MRKSEILIEVVKLAGRIGEIEDAQLYHKGYISVSGNTAGGGEFQISVTVKEAENAKPDH